MKTAGFDLEPKEFDSLAMEPQEAQGRITAAKGPVEMRDFDDPVAIRKNIFNGVKNAFMQKVMENKEHVLRFADVDYDTPSEFTLSDEKKAVLNRRRLYWNLKGRMQLVDKATGAVISEDEKPRKLAEVPYVTRRGTFIHNGTEYLTSHQMRLKPGAYTRVQNNGDVETQFNVLKGSSFRVHMTPETGVFRMQAGQAQMKLYPVLKAMGIEDKTLLEAWGKDLFNANKAADDKTAGTTVQKLVQRLGGHTDQELSADDAAKRLPEIFKRMELDPEVMRRTMGKPHANVDQNVILDATRKILRVHQGTEDPDDRDDLPYQSFHGPEDFFREHVEKDAGQYIRQALWKAGFKKDVKSIPENYFTKQMQSILLGSGLSSSLTEINPAEIYDMRHKITRMGEGGIGSADVVPKGARGVQPTHFGFIDPLRAPESQKIALDLRTTQGTKVGSDGRLYQQFMNPKTGSMEYLHTDAAADKIIAFPGELEKAQGNPKQKIAAMVRGKMSYVPAAKVDYELPHASGMWSPLTWMVPFMSGVKGARVGMGARMQSQALALKDPESPLVMPIHHGSGKGFHEAIGEQMGAVKAKQPGVVKRVTSDGIEVLHQDGTTQLYETYNNMPFNQKGFIHNTPVVKPGQPVGPGDLLARSNYTDANGRAAIGKNVTAAWHMLDGLTHEDAIAISESAAKKFASEQMYEFSKEKGDDIHEISKAAYISQYPSTFSKEQIDRMDDDGVVTPGTILKQGDPIILAVGKQTQAIRGSIMKGHKSAFSDAAETWDHQADAEVVDVQKTQKGPVVTLKSYTPMKPGDKLCYSEDTEILTWVGWKKVSEITTEDRLASLGACGKLEYLQPVAVHSYDHSGRMYSLETTQVSLLVTANHSLYACPRDSQEYGLHRADALFGTRYKLKNNADVLLPGEDPGFKQLPDFTAPAGQGGAGVRIWKGGQISSKCYAFLLGAFLSEGCVLWQPSCGNFGIVISQTKPEGVKRLLSALDEHGLRYSKTGDSYVIYGKALALLFSEIAPPGQGRQCHVKRIPQEVWGWTPELQFELFDWLVWGDGSIGKTAVYYTTVSEGLAGDIQRLALHLGFAANIRVTPAKKGTIKGVEYDFRERYDVVFYLSKNHPEINHGHTKEQKGQRELWVDYGGKVYCPSLPRNHTLYVRRKGKAVWCGNSGLYGNKGVVSKIIPDAEMLQTSDGKPVDIVMNPMGIISRVNPASLAEAALGKIARKTGKSYTVEGFPKHSIAQFALDELAKNGMSDTETIIDPKTGRHIRDVFVGVPYVMKLHHMSEGKMGARETAHYTMDDLPAKGGPEGSKRFGFMEVMGLMSHGVPHFVQDMKLTRGQRNDDFWRMYRLGMTPTTPRISKQYQKFETMLQGAGVSLRKKNGSTQIFPATQKEIEALGAGREITSGDTVDFDTGEPVKGGLFDVAVTGGQGGEHWAHVKLAEPLPNPLVEDPFRSLLGLTKDRYREILAGREALNDIKGPRAIRQALENFNLKREIASTTEEIKAGKRSSRDRLVKRLGFLKAFERLEAHPRDFFLDRVPVLPPKFRPVSKFKETTISADANYLYKDLIEANQNLRESKEAFGDENTADARLQAYDAFKAVVGLGNPIQPETQERNVRGLLKQIVGTSPKYGNFQRRVIGNPVDFVGRSVIIPGAQLDIDEVGLPVDMMWTLFKPFTIRKLSRSGMPMQKALQEWKERTPAATHALMAEAAVRPVVINRAPTLHKYNLTGHFAKPVAGHAMQLSNLILKGHNADYDGDALNIHVPVGEKAMEEVKQKMLPSKMLYSTKSFDVHMLPEQGFVTGLYVGSNENKKRKPRTFASKADAVKAYRSGEIDVDDPIVILRGT